MRALTRFPPHVKGDVKCAYIMTPRLWRRCCGKALPAEQSKFPHSQALEIVASQFGFETWNILSARIEKETGKTAGPVFQPAVPIVRIFDVDKAREFYLDFLGFTLDWEHRFAPDTPLYCQVSRGELRLHLSEHSGDASPGGNMVVYMRGVEAWQKELVAKNYRYNRPGLSHEEWGLEMQVIDPFGNRMRFMEQGGG